MLTACGDDASGATADTAAYCAAAVRLDQAFQAVDADDAAAFPAALDRAHAALTDASANAPAEVTDEYEGLQAALEEVVRTQDPAPFFTDDVVATEAAVHVHDLEACDWAAIDVTAEDYAFAADWPTDAGAVSFDVSNAGAEPHVMIVARKLDSVSAPALDAFRALESDEQFVTSFELSASLFVAPGATDHALADLRPGEYVVMCPIPVGTTGDASIGDGPPHHAEGMLATFTIG